MHSFFLGRERKKVAVTDDDDMAELQAWAS